MYGPQYPLIFDSTTFDPDTAFLLPEGEFFFHTAYSLTNTWGKSGNARRDENGVTFSESDSDGYSIYFDGEIERRFIRLYYGLNKSFELQYVYRDIRLSTGRLDSSVEAFHKLINIGAGGRDKTDRNQLEIYIYDNETNRVIAKITEPTDGFRQESMRLGIKYLIRETANEAISLSITSNFSDYNIEKGINEAADDNNSGSHQEFNDHNLTLRYSSIFPSWTLHVAFSIAFVHNTLLEHSPDELYYFFVGSNWHLSDNWDLLFQILEYSSPFPKDNTSSLNEDVRELTLGLRWFIGKAFALETGFIENQSQGPQNIDIMFFSGTVFHF